MSGGDVVDLVQSLMILALCVAVYRLEGLRRRDREDR